MPYPAEEEGIERITKAAAAATDNIVSIFQCGGINKI
jgi:hypothetical protein